MENDNIYSKINELLGQSPDKFAIIEEQIPIEIQMEYFEFLKRKNKVNDIKDVLLSKELLFIAETPLITKKEILSNLALIDKPEAFRAIEKYSQNPDKELNNWAKLALFESRMLLESSLLEQNRILISSALGGKNNKLRYFIVVFLNEGFTFDDTSKKVIFNEFDTVLKKNNCQPEQFLFYSKFFTLLVLVPLDASLKEAFSNAIDECNQYGQFLMNNFIVTNVKKLSEEEINELIQYPSKKK